jgi:WXG100 family type VII secretion target
MATQMRVNIDAMRQALARYNEAYGTAQGVLTSMRAACGTLAGQWQGQASSTYQVSFNQWCEQYARVVTALQNLCSALQASIARLAAAEDEANQQARVV